MQPLLSRLRTVSLQHLRHNSGIQLRDYQEASISAVLEHLERGEKRLGLSLATGSGKTVVFSHLIDRVATDGSQTLILAHRQELVEQAAKHCRNASSKTIEVEMGSRHASGRADITVASVATMKNRLEKYDPTRFKLIIVDEAHHITAPSYQGILKHFPDAALVGVSATFSRADGISLGSTIDHIVYHKDYLEMIEEDYLSELVITTVHTGVDLSKVSRRGDFAIDALSRAVNTSTTNDLTVRTWLSKAKKRRSTLVFCVDISHVHNLTDTFRQQGIDARCVTKDTKNRAEILQGFRSGEFPVLVNCGIFTEGTDIPNIDCVLLARPTRSRNLLIQMIGRGLRKHPSKKDCHVIDMVGALDTGIVTTPTLFGLDPQEVLEHATKEQIELTKQKKQVKPPTTVTFTEYKDIFEFLDNHNERDVRASSQYAWLEIDDKLFLSNHNGDYLTIKKEQEYNVIITRRLHGAKSPYMTPRVVAKAETRLAAIQSADTWATSNFTRQYITKWARWRSNPATQGQLDFLNKFGKPLTITQGQAGDWIFKIKHGAKGRYQQAQKQAQDYRRQQELEAVERQIKHLEAAGSLGAIAALKATHTKRSSEIVNKQNATTFDSKNLKEFLDKQ